MKMISLIMGTIVATVLVFLVMLPILNDLTVSESGYAVSEIHTGRDTFVRYSDGSVYGMGANESGQLGTGDTSNVSIPTRIGEGLGDVEEIFSNGVTTYLLMRDGSLYGMGANAFGQLGTGDTSNVLTPTRIGEGLGDVEEIFSNGVTTYLLMRDGSLYGMGANESGQLGTGENVDILTPTRIGEGLGEVERAFLFKGNDATNQGFILMRDGSLYGMGANESGQLGTGDTNEVLTPTRIGEGLGDVKEVIVCNVCTYLLMRDGSVYGMGSNGSGSLGTGENVDILTPTRIGEGLGEVESVYSDGYRTYLLMRDGSVYGLGFDWSDNIVWTPTRIGEGLGEVERIVFDEPWAIAFLMMRDGRLYGMGFNDSGSLGTGDTNRVLTPTRIGEGLGEVESVYSSGFTTYLLMSDGSVYGMGSNWSGQLGTGDTNEILTPTRIGEGLGDVERLDQYGDEDVGVVILQINDNSVYGIGWNSFGQLGTGNTNNVLNPVLIMEPTSMTEYSEYRNLIMITPLLLEVLLILGIAAALYKQGVRYT